MSASRATAIFGGTFDPVHFGHLRSALEAGEALGVDTVKLVPASIPPHRDMPGTTPAQRLDMLRLAIDGVDGLEVDARELAREGASYAIDTLRSLRDELGTGVSLTTIIGIDAFSLLHEWREWRRLLDYAHIAILDRPGDAPGLAEELADFSHGKFVEDVQCLRSTSHGCMYKLRLTQMDISATKVREIIESGRSPAYMLPKEVIRYIGENGLYRTTLMQQETR